MPPRDASAQLLWLALVADSPMKTPTYELAEAGGDCVVRITLPELKSAADMQLNLEPQKLHLQTGESGSVPRAACPRLPAPRRARGRRRVARARPANATALSGPPSGTSWRLPSHGPWTTSGARPSLTRRRAC